MLRSLRAFRPLASRALPRFFASGSLDQAPLPTVDWSALEDSARGDEDVQDLNKLRGKWSEFTTRVEKDLRAPVPEIDWKQYKANILSDSTFVDQIKSVVDSTKFDGSSVFDPVVSQTTEETLSKLFARVEEQSQAAAKTLASVKIAQESLLWEKYNLDTLTYELFAARYPKIAEEAEDEVENDEWLVDLGSGSLEKGWGVLVFDENGNPTPRKAEEDHHHH
eukprot:TRINITY_DN177_c0_g1_i2.p1 TRINITY_DN177_c0_g1~~TRINITY_DN177_c0_g1_i2.p1  ORF type:complete len:222 (+),score=97.85 TRINITY_DN177_c0_g1_i2:66-731(+)